MTLATVSSVALRRVRSALDTAGLACPVTQSALSRLGVRSQTATIVRTLAPLDPVGCVAVIDAVLAEREVQERPPPELVWTGPEGAQATARDTAIVLSQLFEGARERVVLAGYSFLNAERVLEPLHRAMEAHGVQTVMLVDVGQPKPEQPSGEKWAQAELGRFRDRNWPFGAPYPELHCDRRALAPAPPWCSLHAKCVSIDGSKAFLSSANFTERGQQRNLEAGVLIHDAPFAQQLERQWMSLIASELTYRYRERHAATNPRPAVAPASGASMSGFADLYPHTREPDALARLAERGVPLPDEVGVDLMVDEESVALAEWRWLERRVALLAPGSPPEAEQRLRAEGWRTVASTDERELRMLADWLREGSP